MSPDPRAYLPIAFVLLFAGASDSISETAITADAAANALIVGASRDLAAADALIDGEIMELMDRLTLITSARAAVLETLKKHDTTSLAVRIALDEIPQLAPQKLNADLDQAKTALAQRIKSCRDQQACLLDLAEGLAQKLDDPRARLNALSEIAIGLRDATRLSGLLSFINSQPSLAQIDRDAYISTFIGKNAQLLAVDGQVERAVALFESVPADRRSYDIRDFGTFLIERGDYSAAVSLSEHPLLDADELDELLGDLMISRARNGDSDAAAYWLERIGGAADHKRQQAAEVAAFSGNAALASNIISAMPDGPQKAFAEIAEAGATRNVLRLKKFADEVNALRDSPLKRNLLTSLAVQFYFVGDKNSGDRFSGYAGSRDDVQRGLIDIYIQTEQISSAVKAADKIESVGARDGGIAAVAVGILAGHGLTAARQYIALRARHQSTEYSPTAYSEAQIFEKLQADGRLADAVEYGAGVVHLTDRAVYLSATDLGRRETLEMALLRVLEIKDIQTKIAAIAALAYKYNR